MNNLLALFPLNTVLFPGATLPLHIFEPRYRRMINRCVQLKQPFGVVLIREGPEVGGPAEPHKVGTTAIIENVLKFADGQMLVSSVGDRRFRITEVVQREPYMVVAVEYLADEESPEAYAYAEQLREQYARHRAALIHATGVEQHMEELPEDPIALSYQLSGQLRIVDLSKQQLLEADLDDRLEAIIDALARELRLLPEPPDLPVAAGKGPWSLN